MRHVVCDLDHKYEDQNLNDEAFMKLKYMNWICMIGLKYDASRHIKRTWLHFVPGKNLDFTRIDPGDLVPSSDPCDWLDILVDGQRNPEKLNEFYKTKITGKYYFHNHWVDFLSFTL